MPPAAKRPRSGARSGARGGGARGRGRSGGRGGGAGASAPAPSAAECKRLAQRLPLGSAIPLLAQLMASSAEAHAAVEAEVARGDAVFAYRRKASLIVYGLDVIENPREQYTRACEARDKVLELVDECTEELSSTQAFAALVGVLSTVEWCAEERELRNGLLGCGGVHVDIANVLEGLAEGMSSAEKASVSRDVDSLKGVVEALDIYGCGYVLKEVVSQMRDK